MGWLSRRRRGSGGGADEPEMTGAGHVPDGWRELVADVLPHWDVLDDAERIRLLELTAAAVRRLRWEAAVGIELDDEIRVVIAAHVAIMGLCLPDDALLSARGVLVQPDDVMMHGEWEVVDGIVSSESTRVSGLTDHNGPIMISWDALVEDVEHPGDGRNLVVHEFAHHLDALDGVSDGTPPMDDDLRARWIPVCAEAYELAAHGRGGDSLDEYAGVNPAEFFAVACEAFFDAPEVLRDEHPELYALFVEYFGIDWAERFDGLAAAGGDATILL